SLETVMVLLDKDAIKVKEVAAVAAAATGDPTMVEVVEVVIKQ
ncbi:MAG: hypothetical protein ACI90V_010305, partial [Bacillariaceae sp.]